MAARNVQWLCMICACLSLLVLCLPLNTSRAGDIGFTNALEQATQAEQHNDLSAAWRIYSRAQQIQTNDCLHLCLLAHKFCDLMRLTNSPDIQKDLASHALVCAQQAVQVDPNNATAHASVAVCYAKLCQFADIKSALNYSRLFKAEAEKAIALDPKQDVAYYLLGRWNYSFANVGLLSRAFVKVVYGGLPPASNDDAIADFKKAIQIAPNSIIHHAGLAMVYETLGERKLQIAELKRCRDLKPITLEDQDAQRDAIQKLTALGQ